MKIQTAYGCDETKAGLLINTETGKTKLECFDSCNGALGCTIFLWDENGGSCKTYKFDANINPPECSETINPGSGEYFIMGNTRSDSKPLEEGSDNTKTDYKVELNNIIFFRGDKTHFARKDECTIDSSCQFNTIYEKIGNGDCDVESSALIRSTTST